MAEHHNILHAYIDINKSDGILLGIKCIGRVLNFYFKCAFAAR